MCYSGEKREEEVIKRQLFGGGIPHEQFAEMLGDYLAVAVGEVSIYNTREEKEKFIGAHAGITEDEMEIPLIAVRRK